MKHTSVLLLGGGLDSTTLLVDMRRRKAPLHALFFQYGQKAFNSELLSCEYFCSKYKVPLKVVNVDLHLLTKSSILEGTKCARKPKKNVLEGRNSIFLSLASCYACTLDARNIYIGLHAAAPGQVLPQDNSSLFISAFQKMLQRSLSIPFKDIEVAAPYLNEHKTHEDIIKLAYRLDPEIITKSFTCYEGGVQECGKCVHCKRKKQALLKLGLT